MIPDWLLEMLVESVVGEFQTFLRASRPQVTIHAAMDRLAIFIEPGAPGVVPHATPVRLLFVAHDLRNVGALGLGGLEGPELGQATMDLYRTEKVNPLGSPQPGAVSGQPPGGAAGPPLPKPGEPGGPPVDPFARTPIVGYTWIVLAAIGGNVARYINHACHPNCYVDVVGHHIWILASRDIRKGEELTYDYNTDGVARIKCRCRPRCRRVL